MRANCSFRGRATFELGNDIDPLGAQSVAQFMWLRSFPRLVTQLFKRNDLLSRNNALAFLSDDFREDIHAENVFHQLANRGVNQQLQLVPGSAGIDRVCGQLRTFAKIRGRSA